MKPKNPKTVPFNSRTRALQSLITPIMACGVLLHQVEAATITWAGTGGDDNWSTAGNWSPGLPQTADAVLFTDADAALSSTAITNLVDADKTITSLSYGQKVSTNFQVTQIPANTTLTVSGSLIVGTSTSGTAVTKTTITGAGSLLVNGTNLSVGNSDATVVQTGSILDLSGLSNFNYNNSAGIVAIGSGNRSGGNIKLANTTNSITAATINLLTSSTSSTVSGTLTLGAGGNTINVNALNIAAQRGTATVAATGVDGTLKIRGAGGSDTDRANITAGWKNNSGGTGGNTVGTLSLNNYVVDMKLNVLVLGQSSNASGTGVNTGSGVLSFNEGTIDVTTLRMAISSASTATATGTLTVGAQANLEVGLGGISLANQSAGSAGGTLTVTGGGSVACSGNIYKSTVAGTGTINLTSSTLTLLAPDTTIGTSAIPIDTLNINGGTLSIPTATGLASISVNSLNTNSVESKINVSRVPRTVVAGDTLTLIKYASISGAGTDFVLQNMPVGITGHLVNNLANQSVDLLIDTASVANLIWSGSLDGDWDTSKLNWVDGTPISYAQDSIVTFDDTATGLTTVNLTMALSPRGVTVNNSTKNYTFTGTGSLEGFGGITKKGSGSLTLGNSGTNTFSGGVTLSDGKLVLAGSADRLPVASIVTLADVAGVELDLNGNAQTLASLIGGGNNGGSVNLGSGTLTLTGAGTYGGVIRGSGTLVKSGTGTQILTNDNLYSGGTTVSGGRIALANLSGSGLGSGPIVVDALASLSIGNGEASGSISATKILNNGTLVCNRSDDFVLTQQIEGGGGITKENVNNIVTIETANPFTGPSTVNGGAFLITHADALGGTASGTTVNNGVSARLEFGGGLTINEPLSLACKSSASGNLPVVVNLEGNNTLAGPISLIPGGSYWTFKSDSDKLTLSGPITNTATTNTRTVRLRGLALGEIQSNLSNSAGNQSLTAVLKEESGTWTLSGTNIYTGSTIVDGGTLLITGSITSSATNLKWGATLGGTGTLGMLTAAGTIAPGVGDIGTLSAEATILSGTLAIEVNGANVDRLKVAGNLNLSGTPVLEVQELGNGATQPSYVIAEFTGTLTGTFAEIPSGYSVDYQANRIVLSKDGVIDPYAAWLNAYPSLTGADRASAADPDKDGLSNGVEFVIGGNPTLPSRTGAPVATAVGSNFIVTFKRSDASEGTEVYLEYGTDLQSFPNRILIPAGAVTASPVVVIDQGDAQADDVTITLPRGNDPKKFARLQVTLPAVP